MMIERNSGNVSYPAQLATFLLSTSGGVIISWILIGVIWLVMVGGIPPSKSEVFLQPRYYNVAMVLQAVLTFFIFFFPAYLFAAICYRKPSQFLGFNLRINYRQLLLVVA